MNTQELVRGIYLVKFTNNKGESTLRKLIKE
ncbi:MAG: T9SS type A sorting domain-containing protein [Bacteroidales bacterium]